jgi:hypothetical protein
MSQYLVLLTHVSQPFDTETHLTKPSHTHCNLHRGTVYRCMYPQLISICVGRCRAITEAVDAFCYIAFVLATGKNVVVWYEGHSFNYSYQDCVLNESRMGLRVCTMLLCRGLDSR